MEQSILQALVVETGRILLGEGLVARTWGNVSCRLGEDSYLITPSGMDYKRLTPQDIACCNLQTGKWEGPHKPSGERGAHAAAYACFPDVQVVLHTHQTYASALGLAGGRELELTSEERAKLGGVAVAAYGLPGTKTLHNAIRRAMQTGAQTILMAHHGALICGSSQQQALERARLLERVCRRCWRGVCKEEPTLEEEKRQSLLQKIRLTCPLAQTVTTKELLTLAATGAPLSAQLDDMAQMLGRQLPAVPCRADAAAEAVRKTGAALIPGVGAIVCGKDEDDTEALAILVQKAAVAALHAQALGIRAELSGLDDLLMHFVYTKKYARQKG